MGVLVAINNRNNTYLIKRIEIKYLYFAFSVDFNIFVIFIGIFSLNFIVIGIGLIVGALSKTASAAGGISWMFVLPLHKTWTYLDIEYMNKLVRGRQRASTPIAFILIQIHSELLCRECSEKYNLVWKINTRCC